MPSYVGCGTAEWDAKDASRVTAARSGRFPAQRASRSSTPAGNWTGRKRSTRNACRAGAKAWRASTPRRPSRGRESAYWN